MIGGLAGFFSWAIWWVYVSFLFHSLLVLCLHSCGILLRAVLLSDLMLTFSLKAFGWVAGWLRKENSHGFLKIRLNSVNQGCKLQDQNHPEIRV